MAEQSAHNRQVLGSNPGWPTTILPMPRPLISAIIPAWSAPYYLPACLASLSAQLAPTDELILVDNGSGGKVAGWAKQFAPAARLLILPQNLGFAGGTNAGIRAAQGEWLLLCNDDALVEPGCVAALAQTLALAPEIGMAAGVLAFSRQPQRIASAGIQVQRDGVANDLYWGHSLASLPPSPTEIFGASGGLALLRRALIEDIGLFDERFFCYLEDVDLAWRARLRGWRTFLAPNARARHVCSASGGAQNSPFKQNLLALNRWRVLLRCLPTPLLRSCLPAILRYDTLAFAYAYLTRQPAIAAGRLAVSHEIPLLLHQRRAIQARRTVSSAALERWLRPASFPLQALLTRER